MENSESGGKILGMFDAGVCAAILGLALFWVTIGTVVWHLT